jgi:hypothetical protein
MFQWTSRSPRGSKKKKLGGKKAGKKSTVAVASDSEDADMENNSEPEEGMS